MAHEDKKDQDLKREMGEQILKNEIKRLEEAVPTIHVQNAPLNIAIIGKHGSGKSSFLNTVMAVFRGEYHEYAPVGDYGDGGDHVTRRFTRYPKEKYIGKTEKQYPTFEDMMGFEDADDTITKKTLELIFNGYIKDGTKVDIHLQNQGNVEDLWLHNRDENSSKVDRIIFVVSAKSENLPFELMKAVVSVASNGSREIPVFGVLSHADKIEEGSEDFSEFKRKFKQSLGLPDLRLLQCSSYCDDIPHRGSRVENVEIPIMKFFREVMDPTRTVFQEERELFEHIRREMNVKLKSITECLLFLTFFFSYVIIISKSEMIFLWFTHCLILFILHIFAKCSLNVILGYRPDIKYKLNQRIWKVFKMGLANFQTIQHGYN